MAFDKYITVKDSQAEIGMYPSTMAWYCKSLKGDKKDLKNDALEIIDILNYLNTQKIEKPKKEKTG